MPQALRQAVQFWRLEQLETRQLLSAVVTTDQPDYAPGSTAVFAATTDGGSTNNFLPGETIEFDVARTDGIAIHSPPAVTKFDVTDGVSGFASYQDSNGTWIYPDLDGLANGAVQANWYVDPQFAGASLQVTATGLTSGQTATADFTDAITLDSVSVGAQSGN
ncbi:MAG TPA: hypothetical protein VLJ39_15260, partial [Tepidisphaeraceae bacterium]|nr:hypothetical protein [Tepidisphaeraceae bacterium]